MMKKKISIKMRLVIISLTVLILAAAVLFCILRFQVITVEGNTQVGQETVIEKILPSKWDRSVGKVLYDKITGTKKTIPDIASYDMEIVSWKELKITVYEKKRIGYLAYMGNYMYFDKDGIVVESSAETSEEIPEIKGLKFDYVVLNEKLPIADADVFSDLLNVTQLIDKYEMNVKKIYISKTYDITLAIGKVRVELGNDDKLSEKLSDLHDIVPNMNQKKAGTLDMREYSENGQYTFRADSKNKK